jgi:hypothetical protein
MVVSLGCSDDGDGSRPVTDFNGVPYAATCSGDDDCGGEEDSCCTGGKCSEDGWCSPRCQSDQECPEILLHRSQRDEMLLGMLG